MSLTNEKEFESWLESFHVNLSFQNIRKKSLYEAVEILITKFLNLKVGNSYIQYFLDIVLERDIRNQAGISDFLNYWDKNAEKFSIPSPEGTNAVRIMTIHKSKGLEFPVVIFPFAEEDWLRKGVCFDPNSD
jgi:ATP-dependent exoDNAse (exonuclease V) beta subunit